MIMQTTNNHSRFSPLILYCWIVLDYCSCCLLSESLIFWVYLTPQFIAVFFKFVFFPAYVVCGLINLSVHVYHSLQSLCNTGTIFLFLLSSSSSTSQYPVRTWMVIGCITDVQQTLLPETSLTLTFRVLLNIWTLHTFLSWF